MGIEEHGLALLLEPLDEPADAAPADGIDAVGRLVEDHEVGVVHQRLRDADPLPHPLAVLPHRPAGPLPHADEVEEFGLPGAADRPRHAGQGGEVVEHLAAGEIVGKAVVLGEIADPGQRRLVAHRHAEDGSLGMGCGYDRGQDLDEGALAGAVGAEEAEDLTAVDLQVDPLQGADPAAAAKHLFHAADVDRRAGRGGGGRGGLDGAGHEADARRSGKPAPVIADLAGRVQKSGCGRGFAEPPEGRKRCRAFAPDGQ